MCKLRLATPEETHNPQITGKSKHREVVMSFRSQRTLVRILLSLVFAGGLGLSAPVHAQDASDAEPLFKKLESMAPADREKTLIEGAKKEGAVVWYSTDSPRATQDVFKAFTDKYPFIKPGFIRGKSQDILDRITTEARAGRRLFDVAKTSTETFGLYPVDVFASYNSPIKAGLPDNMKGERWASIFTFVRALGYNTNMLKEQDLPKNWEDLLDSKWKGKILFDPSSLPEVMALYERWGMQKASDYFDRLGTSGNLQIRDGRTVITQLISAGEAPLGVTVYPYDVEMLKSKGAPIDWALIDPSPGLLQPTSIARYAPHPYSAALLYDFILSAEGGQKVYAKMGRVPADPNVESKGHREQAAIKDTRMVFNSEGPGSTVAEDSEKILNEKILNKAFKK
jgi:iron(III) transport system substrate-binding protein